MADFTSAPFSGDYTDESAQDYILTPQSNTLTTFTNVAGALVSLALVVGIGIWGYKLLVRDVSGIPVVRAVSGEMRVRPEEPGGVFAQHQGLSVNEVAAEGAAGRPADELRLAPQPMMLQDEDQVLSAAMVASAPQQGRDAVNGPDVAAALPSGHVDDLVADLTSGAAPAPNAVEKAVKQAVADVQAAETKIAAVVLDAPGVRRSLRPQKRPADLPIIVPAALKTQSAPEETKEVDAASLPAGTRLAQLGAFGSPEVAREQWDQIKTRFGVYLEGKQRIVQKATSGGRVFYRLRAMGFEDLGDARRFCSALVAENADCIPVVTR
ncbi:MAG: hypothetical protein ACJAVM_000943 [Sulfitobacter sp.]|jgi:hypothetical protein